VALKDRPCRLDDLRRSLLAQIIRQVLFWQDELGRGVLSPRVLAAIARVPREEFLAEHLRHLAYRDEALDIPCGQRISQPSIVAAMTDLLGPEPHRRLLEVGTGCGYQTAVLSQLAASVYSVELEDELAADAVLRLAWLGCDNVAVRVGDGAEGWPRHAPFDRILVTAAAREVPERLLAQLRPGGRLVLPVGEQRPGHGRTSGRLAVIDKGRHGGIRRRDLLPVRFVPLRRPREDLPEMSRPIVYER
jgi:protein-L-isoaspartate(D-aspartate) O-methyltransferase